MLYSILSFCYVIFPIFSIFKFQSFLIFMRNFKRNSFHIVTFFLTLPICHDSFIGQNESTTYRHGHIRSSYDNNYKNFKSTVNGGTADPAPRASSFENSKHRFQKKIPGTTPGGSKSSIKVKLDSI